MTHPEFDQHVETIFTAVRDLAASKGREYAGGENRFANFERLATRTGMTREQVWLVYFTKHLDSIETYIREGGKVTQTEPIQGRIRDAITYLTLLDGMIEESKPCVPPIRIDGTISSGALTMKQDSDLDDYIRSLTPVPRCRCHIGVMTTCRTFTPPPPWSANPRVCAECRHHYACHPVAVLP